MAVLLLGDPRLRSHAELVTGPCKDGLGFSQRGERGDIKHSCVCMCLVVLGVHYLTQGRLRNCLQGTVLPALTPVLSLFK